MKNYLALLAGSVVLCGGIVPEKAGAVEVVVSVGHHHHHHHRYWVSGHWRHHHRVWVPGHWVY